MRNAEFSNRDTKALGELPPPGDREEEIMISTVAATAEGKPFSKWNAIETVRWHANTFMAEWTDQYYGRQVLAPDAVLRYMRASRSFPVYQGETEESAAERLLCKHDVFFGEGFPGYGIQYIAESVAEMVDFLGTVLPALKYFDASRLAAFDRIIWKAFELDGEEILCRYMEADLERQVSREELDEWWLNEMLHDMPGFLRAIQAEAAATDPADNYQWWEYHR